MNKVKPGRVIVLLSKYHGSNQQLLAIAKHLNHGEVVSVRCELRSRSTVFNALYRFIIWFRALLGGSHVVSNWLVRSVLKNSVVCNEGDIVIAKTPPFEFPMQIMAAGSGAKTYFVGQPKRLSPAKYDLLISTPSTPVKTASLELEMLPTSFTYDEFQRARTHLSKQNDYWCLLVGGNARGFSYEDSHWEMIANYVLSSCVSENIHWVISTSPRTGSAAEDYFKQRLTESAGFKGYLYLWQEAKTNVQPSIMLMLASSDRVYVTEDSASMLSEAVNSRLPVISLRPEVSEFNSLTTPSAEYQSQKNRVIRLTIEELCCQQDSVSSWIKNEFVPVSLCWSQTIKSIL